MNLQPHIAIVGIGNLGWNLARRMRECHIPISQIVARDTMENQALATETKARLVPSIDRLGENIDLVFLCVPDDQLSDVARSIKAGSAIVHCSGSIPLFDFAARSGVFYAFQTFTKNYPVAWKNVPIFIQSEDQDLKIALLELANKISGNAKEVTSEQRKFIHIAGVFGANFVNHTLHLAHEVLQQKELDFQVMEPLLKETIRKAFDQNPLASQTGPARRGDAELIKQHLEDLSFDDNLASFYRQFTDSIRKSYEP